MSDGRLTRRTFLGVAGGSAVAVGLAGVGGLALGRAAVEDERETTRTRTYAFAGAHQAGIVTPAQDRMYTAAYDLTTDSRDELVDLLRRWTVMGARLTRGLPAGPLGFTSGPYDAPPEDTGEAMDLPAAGLTLTLGFGRSLFTGSRGAPGDRFGLEARLPDALVDLPHFSGDDLDPARSGGDIVVQACADDPQVAVHAIRNLTRAAFGTARVRWSQLGYGRTSATSRAQVTPRNLFGFKDGTANIMAEETDELERQVWVQPGDGGSAAGWLAGGTYLVARRIRMDLETWDRTSLREQEGLIGRAKGGGAPLSGGEEHTAPDFAMAGRGGEPLIPMTSHVRLSHPVVARRRPDAPPGLHLHRRQRPTGPPRRGPVLRGVRPGPADASSSRSRRSSPRQDALMEYLTHTGSGLYAVPPGVPAVRDDGSLVDDGFLGAPLFA